MITLKRFYMIRHGETEANAAKIMAGSLDSPLTATGRAQAETARRTVENLETRPAVILHSPLSRARETAEIINTHMNLPMVSDPDLAEMDAGEWEGASYDLCRSMLDGWRDPPGGETFPQFITRVMHAKNRALSGHTGPILFVSHGGLFRAFAKLYGRDIWGVRNADLHEFEPYPADRNFPWRVHIHHYEKKMTVSPSDSYHPDETNSESAIA